MIICGGTIIDGSGAPGYAGDIALQDGKIAAVGKESGQKARRVIDASGKVVTPGFIDIHRHGDAAAFRPDFGAAELCQGLTTIINGNCGLSVAPIRGENTADIKAYLRPITGMLPGEMPTDSLKNYLNALCDLPLHCGMLVGGGVVRATVAGYREPRIGKEQIRNIRRELETALGDGALGVSLGLGYAPECFYTTGELIEALAPVAGTGIPVTVHMRQEGTGVTDSVSEMMQVARALRCPLHISHLKAMGRTNWGTKIPRALELLHRAKEEGLDVSCDVYPYTAGSTQLLHILPPDLLEGGMEAVTRRLGEAAVRRELAERIEAGEGFDDIAKLAGWDGIYLTSLHCPEDHAYQGKNLAEIAAMMGTDPLNACCDLLIREHGQITMIDFMAAQEDIISILRSPLSNVISDATYPTEGMPHPRVYGTFPHLIEHFVMQEKALTLESAVHKITMRPADVLGLKNKGRLQVGCDGDICIFDPKELHAPGTYEDPARTAQGMDFVLVDGEVALEAGKPTGVRKGKAIRR